MKSYEYYHYFNPKLKKTVYKHKGSGVVFDSIFKPLRKMLIDAVVKPLFKKTLESGVSYAGEKIGKKIVDKASTIRIPRRKKGTTTTGRGKTLAIQVPQTVTSSKQLDMEKLYNAQQKLFNDEQRLAKKRKNKLRF